RMVERTQARLTRRLEQVFGLEVRGGQSLRRQIAAPVSQVRGNIAQDIHQLQPFAEPHAIRKQKRVIQWRLREKVRAAYLCPELANAAGDTIGVIIQLLIGA